MAIIKSNLNGTWCTVYQEFEGTEIPKAQFDGQQLILQDSTYSVIGPYMDEGIIKVSGQHLDIYGTDGENKGRHYCAIYKIENSRLTICYDLTGISCPLNFETTNKPKHFLCVFERL